MIKNNARAQERRNIGMIQVEVFFGDIIFGALYCVGIRVNSLRCSRQVSQAVASNPNVCSLAKRLGEKKRRKGKN